MGDMIKEENYCSDKDILRCDEPIIEELPHLEVQEGLPHLEVQEGLPHLEVQEELPHLEVQEGLPHLEVQEELPHLEIQDHPDLESDHLQNDETKETQQCDGNHVEQLSLCQDDDDDDATDIPEVTGRKEEEVVELSPNCTSQLQLKKMKQIEDVITSDPFDIERLRQLATEHGGLVQDELRKKAWPMLMMVDKLECPPKPRKEDIISHKEYKQVVMDVNRTLKRFPPDIDDEYRVVLMEQLTTLIIRVLLKHTDLHYYQGFHDVAITFLLVVGEDVGYELVEKLSIDYLRDFMRPTMERTTYYLTYLYPILDRANPELYIFLVKSGVGTVFCLPWLITWFAHTLSDYRNVVRLYDFFLSSPYLMPMYIAAAIVMHREEDILAGECDMAMQHYILSQVPDTLPFEDLLVKATELYNAYPPDSLDNDVQLFVDKVKREEEEDRKLAQKRAKQHKAFLNKRTIQPFVMIAKYFHITPGVVKFMAFAITATIATSLYGYYTRSLAMEPYFSFGW